MRNIISIILILSFFLTSVIGPALGQGAVALNLPKPGAMIGLSESFAPVVLKGVSIHRDDPLLFDFIVDAGDSGLNGQKLTDETTKLVKYFLAGLAVPEQDLWVNLSPAEKDRIMADPLSHTDVGRDMLTQDYILKQVTATLMYPEKDLGRKFWDEIYRQVHAQLGNRDVPVDTFNKVWITPDETEVYQHDGQAFVTKAHLKVMLESDYLAMSNNRLPTRGHVAPFVNVSPSADITKNVLRAIIIPILEKEVNEGKNFAALRQIFHSLILAGWHKRAMKESLLSQVYAGTNKIDGIDIAEKNARQKVYARYLEAYRRGVYNYVKDEFDQATRETLPRKYFSGGIVYDRAMNPDFAADSAGVSVDHGQVRTYRLQKKADADFSMGALTERTKKLLSYVKLQVSQSGAPLSIEYIRRRQGIIDLFLEDLNKSNDWHDFYLGSSLNIDREVELLNKHIQEGTIQAYFKRKGILKDDRALWIIFSALNEQVKIEMNNFILINEFDIGLKWESSQRFISMLIREWITVWNLWEAAFHTYLTRGIHGINREPYLGCSLLLGSRLGNPYLQKDTRGYLDHAQSDEKKWKKLLLRSAEAFTISWIAIHLSNIFPDISSFTVFTQAHTHWPSLRQQLRRVFYFWSTTKKVKLVQRVETTVKQDSEDLGGIDLGQGDYLKVVGTDAAGMVRVDRAEILRLQQDLRGFVPIPVGNPYPVKPGMFPAVPSVAPSS